jgi:hypothetical protein
VVCFTIREGAFEEYGYRRDMAEIQDRGLWVEEEPADRKMFESGVMGKVGVFTVSG